MDSGAMDLGENLVYTDGFGFLLANLPSGTPFRQTCQVMMP